MTEDHEGYSLSRMFMFGLVKMENRRMETERTKNNQTETTSPYPEKFRHLWIMVAGYKI